MAITPHPIGSSFVLKTATVVFKREGATDSDDFSLHIGDIILNPTIQSGSWTGCSGNVISEQGVATWAAQFGLLQDLEDNGLLWWLMDHEGEKADVTATLKSGADPVYFTVTLSPAQIGGAIGANPLSSSVTMACDGKPTKTPPA